MGGVPVSNRFIVDFLTVSFDRDDELTPERLLSIFTDMTGLDPDCFVKSDIGAMTGYNRSYKYLGEKKISINWHDTIMHQGVNINLTGQGCATIAERDLIEFLKFAKERDARFTRVDIALDDVSGVIPYQTITDAFVRSSKFERYFSSRSSLSTLSIYLHNTGLETVYNVSLGSRQSVVRWRLYDKAHEQRLRDVYWRRLEFTVKYEHAETMVNAILAGNVANCFAFYCNNYMRILDECIIPDSSMRVDTIKSHPLFIEFLDDLVNGQFDVELPETYTFKEEIKQIRNKYTQSKLIDLELLLRLNYYYHKTYGRFIYLRNTFPNFFAELDILLDDVVISPKYRAIEQAIYNSIQHPLCESC